jgi:hypothetical protein
LFMLYLTLNISMTSAFYSGSTKHIVGLTSFLLAATSHIFYKIFSPGL